MVKRTKKVAKSPASGTGQSVAIQKTTDRIIGNQNKNSEKKIAVKSKIKSNKKVFRQSVTKSSKKIVPIMATIVLLGLFILSLFMLLRDSKHSADAIILHDLHRLHEIFQSIDKDCKIIDFEHTKNYIDFLTVKEFVGSEVGAMNVSYPHNWKGPYVQDNPTVHQQQYIVLKNKAGYYLVPGDGVKLANGKVIGKDIIFDENSDMEKLLQDEQALKTVDGPLAKKLSIGGSYIKQVLQTPLRYL